MYNISLTPINLASFGVRRATSESIPDLVTIWHTPYPVLTNYKLLCNVLGIEPFAGGTFRNQGSHIKPGYITSGYRDRIIEGRKHSPHLYGLAIDIAVGDIEHQIIWAKAAFPFFTRVGLYPDNGIIHVDLMPRSWMQKYNGTAFWIRKNGVYTGFWDLDKAITFAKGE